MAVQCGCVIEKNLRRKIAEQTRIAEARLTIIADLRREIICLKMNASAMKKPPGKISRILQAKIW